MKPIHLLIVGILVLLTGLLIHAPAAVVYAWTLGARTDLPVRVHGIRGQLFAGSAAQLSYGNRPIASDLHWKLRPASLLLGRAAFHVRSGGAPLLFDGVLASGLGGTRVSGLKASGELRALAALAGQSFIPVNGQAGIDLDHLLLKDQWPHAAEGRIQLLSLSWALGQPVVLGDFEAQLRSEDGNIIAAVTTLSGVVDVLGDARLNTDRSYAVDLRLRPRTDAPPMLINMLQSLGPADSEGYHRLRQGAGLVAPVVTPAPTPQQPGPGTAPSPKPTAQPRHHMMPPVE
jgi:general secretion pathway protein N